MYPLREFDKGCFQKYKIIEAQYSESERFCLSPVPVKVSMLFFLLLWSRGKAVSKVLCNSDVLREIELMLHLVSVYS
jgi:arginine exporter protein ArgO